MRTYVLLGVRNRLGPDWPAYGEGECGLAGLDLRNTFLWFTHFSAQFRFSEVAGVILELAGVILIPAGTISKLAGSFSEVAGVILKVAGTILNITGWVAKAAEVWFEFRGFDFLF